MADQQDTTSSAVAAAIHEAGVLGQATSSRSRTPSASSSSTVSSSSPISGGGSLSGASSGCSIPSPQTPPNLHQNSIDPASRYLVQKFGGTSVGKFAVNIARDVVSNYIDSNKVIVVCSARSGSTKALGTTNLLLKAASETLERNKVVTAPPTPGFSGTITPFSKGGIFGTYDSWSTPYGSSPPLSPRSRSGSSGSPTSSFSPLTAITVPKAGETHPTFNKTVDVIRAQHLSAAQETIQNANILAEVEAEIERDCDWLRGYLFAAQVIDEISPRSKDNIVGLGERLACKIMTGILRDQGIDAEYVSLENIVPEFESDDSTEGVLDQAFYDRLATAVGERIKQCGPRVPVVTGFFGPVPGSLLRQVGRGYTDLLAALVAVGTQASELQIWKEVDGIFTADPRKVPTARLISVISPEEAAELTYYGSEVVHPFTMEQVIRRKIPIRIKNVENPRGGGTVIHPDPDVDTVQELGGVPEPLTPSTLSLLSSAHQGETGILAASGISQSGIENNKEKSPTAVTIKENIVVLNVNSNRKSVSHGFLAGIFSTLDRFGVVVDLISTSEVHVSMAIEDGVKGRSLDRLLSELKKMGTVSVHREMAILSLVGKQMRNLVGIAGRMFTTLAQGNVNIEMISQGASEITISCVIEQRDAIKALNLIHQSCLQIKPQGARGRVGPWLF